MKSKKKLSLKKMNIAQLDSIRGGSPVPLPRPTVLTIYSPCDYPTITIHTNHVCAYPETNDICMIHVIN